MLADVERAMLTGTRELSAYAIAKRVGVKVETAKSMWGRSEKSSAQRDPWPLETNDADTAGVDADVRAFVEFQSRLGAAGNAE